MLKIGTGSAAKGAKGHGFIKVGELSVHSEIVIPLIIVNGRKEGPILWINGAVHGDEINAFMASRRLAYKLDPQQLQGAVIFTPISNPPATQWRQKLNPYDSLDLDQQFPGDPEGLFSQRIAYSLFREIKDTADYLINFHTAGTQFTAPPYVVYKMVSGVKTRVSREAEILSRVFGASTLCKVNFVSAKGELPGSMGGALDVNCLLQGIPAFMAEIGSGGRFEEENIKMAEQGVKNVMKALKMIPGEIEVPKRQIVVTKRRFLYCDRGGFLIMDVKPGTFAGKGQKMARIVDLFSELETIQAKEKTLIIQVRTNPIVHTGDRVALIGLEWQEISSSSPRIPIVGLRVLPT